MINTQQRAFGGLKWYWEIKQIERDFKGLVEHREMKDHFYGWLQLSRKNSIQADFLTHYAQKKEYLDQHQAFSVWKSVFMFRKYVVQNFCNHQACYDKQLEIVNSQIWYLLKYEPEILTPQMMLQNEYFKIVTDLVNKEIIQIKPSCIMINVFAAWKRAHQFEKIREQCEDLADANYQLNLAKHTFGQWKTLAKHDMERYISIKKAMSIITTTMLTSPFYTLVSLNEVEKTNENRLFYLRKSKSTTLTHTLFLAWKSVAAESKLETLKMLHIHNHFKEPLATESDQNSEITFEVPTLPYYPSFSLPAKLHSQTTVMNSIIRCFQAYTPLTTQPTLQKYFNTLKYHSKLSKLRKEQYDYSAIFY